MPCIAINILYGAYRLRGYDGLVGSSSNQARILPRGSKHSVPLPPKVRVFFTFLQRVSIACYAEPSISYSKSVRLSVRLSVTRWH